MQTLRERGRKGGGGGRKGGGEGREGRGREAERRGNRKGGGERERREEEKTRYCVKIHQIATYFSPCSGFRQGCKLIGE